MRSRLESERLEQQSDIDNHFFRLSHVMLMEAGLDGKFHRLNPAWSKTLGWNVDEIMRRPFQELIHSDDISKTMAALESLRSGEEVAQFDNRYLHKNGTYRTLRWNISPGGNREKIFGVVDDITEQVRTRAALETDKRMLERVMTGALWNETLALLMLEIEALSGSGMSCSVLLLDESGTRLLNGAAPSLPAEYNAMIHGLSIGPVAGSCGTAAFRQSRVCVDDIETDALWQNYSQFALKFGLKACCSTPIFSSDNKLLGTIANYYSRPHKADAYDLELMERAAHLAGIVIERHRQEEAARRLQAETDRIRRLYETVLSNTPDLAYVFDREYRFTYANTGLLAMWGRTWDESIGKTCLELGYEPWHAELHKREIDEVIATRKSIRGQVPQTGPFGRRVFDYIFVPVISDNGEVEAVAGTTRDVTEIKEAEEQLRENGNRLTELNDKLAVARDEALAANQAKSTFLANMSHELRTPLNAMIGYAELLQEDLAQQCSEEALGDFARIRQAGKHLLSLINDVLDMAKIEAGKLDINIESVSVRDILSEVIDTMKPLAEQKNNELVVKYQEPIGMLRVDPMRLKQVLLNLLSNASKFTENGTITLECVHEMPGVKPSGDQHPGNGWMIFCVKDTGMGMTEKQMEQLFQKFQQGDPSFTRKYGGTGLGLAITRELCRMMGAEISADSEVGRGSVFTVRFPQEAS